MRLPYLYNTNGAGKKTRSRPPSKLEAPGTVRVLSVAMSRQGFSSRRAACQERLKYLHIWTANMGCEQEVSGLDRSFIENEKGPTKPAPNADRTTVLMANALDTTRQHGSKLASSTGKAYLAAFMRYVSIR